MIKEINMTGSHTIFYTEFIAATLNLKKVLQQYQDDSLIYSLFKDFDHQDIDVLTVQNLTASLTRMGKEVTIEQIEKIIRELNLPGPELKIDYQNFKRIIMLDPMTALLEKKDQHPLFVLEEEDENYD